MPGSEIFNPLLVMNYDMRGLIPGIAGCTVPPDSSKWAGEGVRRLWSSCAKSRDDADIRGDSMGSMASIKE